jgi:hypothetical protein
MKHVLVRSTGSGLSGPSSLSNGLKSGSQYEHGNKEVAYTELGASMNDTKPSLSVFWSFEVKKLVILVVIKLD